VNETLILEMAEAMVTTGLASLGYQYINIDAGYLLPTRDSDGRLQVEKTTFPVPLTTIEPARIYFFFLIFSAQVNPAKFPNGIRHVADRLHAMGLKLGVYTDLGEGSCGSGPGSYGFYTRDAETFADTWHADYLKVIPIVSHATHKTDIKQSFTCALVLTHKLQPLDLLG
jgi:alpha-galactosidase